MFTSKHLKMLQHVSIIIQTIFRELVCSLLKSLILKFVKNVKVNVVMRQHNIWCEDDLNKIKTCWSVFKCFNVNILD